MSRTYGWTGQIRQGLWKCKKCSHWNYYRTATLRIDSTCSRPQCDYRARVVLDRVPRAGGRPRQVSIHEYPSYRPPSTIRREQRDRNRFERRNREVVETLDAKMDRGVFRTAGELQDAFDERDLERHGGIFRFRARPERPRHPIHGNSRLEMTRVRGTNEGEDESE